LLQVFFGRLALSVYRLLFHFHFYKPVSGPGTLAAPWMHVLCPVQTAGVSEP